MRRLKDSSSFIPEPNEVVIRLTEGTYVGTHDEIQNMHRELTQALEGLARVRIRRAQDTVDEIRSKNALRSDFV